MKKIELKCPNCNGSFQSENGLDEYACPYCGSRIVMEMSAPKLGIKAGAKLAAERQERKTEAQRLKLEEKRLELEAKERKAKQERRNDLLWLGVLAAIILACAITYVVASGGEDGSEEQGPFATSAESQTQDSASTESLGSESAKASGDSEAKGEFLSITTANQADVRSGDKVEMTGSLRIAEVDEGAAPVVTHDGKAYSVSVVQQGSKSAYDMFELEARSLPPESVALIEQCIDEYLYHQRPYDHTRFSTVIRGTAQTRISNGRLAEEDSAYSELGGWTLTDAEILSITASED